jgi:farnesyl diphosphate synthase
MNKGGGTLSAQQRLEQWRAHIEAGLEGVSLLYEGRLSSACGTAWSKTSPALLQASRYVLSGGGGKLLRGLLTVSVAHDLRKSVGESEVEKKAIAVAVGIEAMHAASLVHDDLPALDNDDLRRGRPSCHKAFDEATAILTADALFGVALFRVTTEPSMSSDEHARVSRILSQAWVDLCLGQDLDLAQQRRQAASASITTDQPQDHLAAIGAGTVRLKTGALFGAAVASGALVAGVAEARLEDFWRWGVRIGECFQALDDLSDGDKPASERDAVHNDCRVLRQQVGERDSRLASGTTARLMDNILAL